MLTFVVPVVQIQLSFISVLSAKALVPTYTRPSVYTTLAVEINQSNTVVMCLVWFSSIIVSDIPVSV